jgi:glycosyltransferase involved in cell wall biosynthesis
LNRVPRILQVGKFYPPYRGGIETHLEALCDQIRQRFDVHVIASNHRRGRSEEVRNGIPITRLSTAFSITTAPVNPSLPAAIRALRPDLLHIHLPHPGGVLGVLASGYRGPIVVTYHSDIVRQRVMSAVFRPFLDALLRRASTIVVASPAYLESSPTLASHRARCRVVPYGISPERFEHADRARVRQLRDRYGDRLVLAVGRLVYYKGFDVLVRAMRSVEGRLLIIGDGPLRAQLVQEAAAAGVAAKVAFLGEVEPDAVPSFFQAADVFVLPSVARSEAFGIVQLEAMASGTPVVNTNLESGVPWVSQHLKTGLTVPPGDADALAAAIERLLSDVPLRQRLGATGRARVRAEFDVDVMGRRVMEIYDEALRRAGAAAGAVA